MSADYREGRPLTTVETEANGDSRSTYERGWLVYWARSAGTNDVCHALAALVGPVQSIFSSLETISLHLSSKLGRQTAYIISGSHLCIPRNETVQPPYFQKRFITFCLPIPTLIYL